MPLRMQCNETPMPEPKTAMISARLPPSVKEALRRAVECERRSLANMLEVMISDWSRAHEDVPSTPLRATGRADVGPAANG